MLHLIIGVLAALLLWKTLKMTFKLLLWLVPIGGVCLLVFPHAFAFVGGIGILALGLLGTLFVLGIAGLLFSLGGD